jgi:spectinomycin phosphotransferase
MAPIPTTSRRLWTDAHGFAWMLHPFFDGKDGYEVELSRAQWSTLGAAMRAVHTVVLPADLADKVPRESYSPRWRDVVRALDRQVDTWHEGDSAAVALAVLWQMRHNAIRRVVERAERLAGSLGSASPALVVCHADLHGANVLVRADGELAIVDWDEVILAPKERDLMSVGGGLFGRWNPDMEEVWFYEGYGPAEVDPVVLAYYRYERIVADIAAWAEQILAGRGGPEDRENGVRQLASQFLPGHVVEIADRSYPG